MLGCHPAKRGGTYKSVRGKKNAFSKLRTDLASSLLLTIETAISGLDSIHSHMKER